MLHRKCIQKFVEMWDIFSIQIFCIHFVQILCTKCMQKFVEMWDTFCKQLNFGYINSDLQKMHIIKIMYTICIENSYRMHIQIIVCRMNSLFQHNLTHLLCTSQLIMANNQLGLRLETCWLITEGTYQINGLMDCILH